MIKGFVFDFDGLIIDTEIPEYTAWKEIYARFNATLPFEEWSKCLGSDYNSFDPVQYLISQTGLPLDYDEILPQQRTRSHELAYQEDALPGVRTLIEEAKNGGLLLAVASSSDAAWVHGHLERLNLKPLFKTICTEEDVARVKPEPDLFRLAVQRLGIEPVQAVAFEDTKLGIQSAKKAGLYCIAVPNQLTAMLDLSKADWKVNSLAEISLKMILERFA
jgi:HAD superfamily hydrolase (TIGR01509 family)